MSSTITCSCGKVLLAPTGLPAYHSARCPNCGKSLPILDSSEQAIHAKRADSELSRTLPEPGDKPSPNWFYESGQKPVGPFSWEQLHQLFASKILSPQNLVWQEGTREWIPAYQVLGLISPSHSVPPPLPALSSTTPLYNARELPKVGTRENAGLAANSSPLTNSALPTTANMICVYGMLINPILWILGQLTCLMTLPQNPRDEALAVWELLLHLAITFIQLVTGGALFFGSWQLSHLKKNARVWSMAGLLGNVGSSVVYFFLSGILVVAAGVRSAGVAPAPNAGTTVIVFFMTMVGLCAFIAEILMGVWLYRHGDQLNLRDHGS